MQTFAFMSGGHNPRMMHSLRYNPKVCKLSSRSQGRYEDGEILICCNPPISFPSSHSERVTRAVGCKRARSSSLSMKNTGGGKDLIQELQSQIVNASLLTFELLTGWQAGLTRSLQQTGDADLMRSLGVIPCERWSKTVRREGRKGLTALTSPVRSSGFLTSSTSSSSWSSSFPSSSSSH
eukprot:746828-Hanusia_phi.AAC.10